MQAYVADAGPLVRALCDQLELVRIIDDACDWDPLRSKLSPGERILALILSMFMRQRPLYRVHESFRRADVQLLLGRGVTIDDLHDDGFGQALDKLFDAGAAGVFGALCARTLILEDVQHDFVHWDSTSRSLFGDYQSDQPQPLITFGHSKDHRPDLKQIMLHVLANREGMPLWGGVEPGNSSDKKLNGEMIDQIRLLFAPESLASMTYVADSAFVTKANLAKANTAGMGILSRLPETFAAGASVKHKAFADDNWQDIGRVAVRRQASSYQASEQEAEVDGVRYRLVVYRSSHLEKRKEHSLKRDLEKERAALADKAREMFQGPFTCREDAEARGHAWLKLGASALHPMSFVIREEQVRDKRPTRGRPKKGDQPTYHTDYRVDATIGDPRADLVEKERQRRSAFVLITTIGRDRMAARALLQEYKQQGSIERRFAFMKDREIVDSFFLKKPERVEALGYVLLMVVLLFSVLERRVRQAGIPLPTLSRGELANPTGLEILRNLSVSVIELDDGQRHLSVHTGFDRAFDAILTMARVDKRVYTELRPRSTA